MDDHQGRSPAHGPDDRQLRIQLAAVGPYFAIDAEDGGEPGAGFRPLRELYATGPGSFLSRRIADVARQLGTREERVAGSIVQLGLAARLWSVALGSVALGAGIPDLHPDRVRWRMPAQGGPLELRVPHLKRPGDDLYRAVVVGNLAPLNAAVRAVAPVAERLLWGNAASALAGTLRVLHGRLAADRPQGCRAAEAAARELLDRTPLRGTGELSASAPPSFRRSSCCLYYRLPDGGLCGDCVFTSPPHRTSSTSG
jgi:hypothetical protein